MIPYFCSCKYCLFGLSFCHYSSSSAPVVLVIVVPIVITCLVYVFSPFPPYVFPFVFRLHTRVLPTSVSLKANKIVSVSFSWFLFQTNCWSFTLSLYSSCYCIIIIIIVFLFSLLLCYFYLFATGIEALFQMLYIIEYRLASSCSHFTRFIHFIGLIRFGFSNCWDKQVFFLSSLVKYRISLVLYDLLEIRYIFNNGYVFLFRIIFKCLLEFTFVYTQHTFRKI